MLTNQQTCLLSLTRDATYEKFFFREFLDSEIYQKIPPPCNAVVKNGTERVPKEQE
jgi:hypothetical protein